MSDVATYTVRAEFEGETHSFPCRADQTVLNAAEAAGITLPQLLLLRGMHHLCCGDQRGQC